eukprot:scaffold11741_cov83-Alexandrium_tamarense.AAC.1
MVCPPCAPGILRPSVVLVSAHSTTVRSLLTFPFRRLPDQIIHPKHLLMLRNTAVNCSRSLWKSCVPSIQNRSFPSQYDGHDFRILSSLPLHTFSRQHHVSLPPCRDDDTNRNNTQMMSLRLSSSISNSIMNTSLYKQLNNTTYSNITLREYHATTANDRAAVIALSLGAIAATAKAGQYA